MFFAPFAVIMLATRFVGMRWLQLLPPPVVVGLGLLTYGAGLFGMTTIALAPLCGALFGFGYGVTLPSSIEWSTRLYPQNRRPVALINSSFQAGSIIALQTTRLLLASIGWGGVLTALGTMVAVVFLMIAVTQAVRQ
jgi:hypothetical protein